MATFFGSPPFVSHPVVRTQHLSSSSQPPPPTPPPQLPSQPPSLNKSSQEQQQPLVVSSDKSQLGGRGTTSADSTDWIASSLTRRFGLGAGLAWAGFLAFGVVSEQVKTRFEVNQQEANTRFDIHQELNIKISS